MKVLIFAILFTSSAFAKNALPSLESKMWNFIKDTQIRDNKIIRTKGGWPSFSRFKGTNIHSPESNSFVTTQLLVALNNVENNYEFPGFQAASIEANHFFDLYLEDTKRTHEPDGTIAYWPLLETPSGKLIRSFSTKFPYRNLKPFNVPNDLDASANFFMWLYKNNTHSDYLASFEKTAGFYLDSKRQVEYKNDHNWKATDSGAFLTWVDDEKINSPKSRIYNGVNDVDCVVNLNILSALLTYKNHIGNLSSETASGLSASCKLINKAVFAKKTNVCAVWYDRSSQFYTAYAKAYTAQENINCLNNSLEVARRDILNLSKIDTKNYTQIAEFISVIKKLWKPAERPLEVSSLLLQLENRLRQGISVENNHAYIKSTDSLFIAKLGILTIEWYSPQFETAVALEALLLP
jgi:hypothetical protein